MRDAVGHTLQPEQIWQWDMGSAMVMHAPWHPAKYHGAAEPWQPRWCHGDACTVACTVPCAYSCRGSVDVPWHNYAMVHSNVAMGHHKYTHGTDCAVAHNDPWCYNSVPWYTSWTPWHKCTCGTKHATVQHCAVAQCVPWCIFCTVGQIWCAIAACGTKNVPWYTRGGATVQTACATAQGANV